MLEKLLQMLLQNATAFDIKNHGNIYCRLWQFTYYKTGQSILQNMEVLQNGKTLFRHTAVHIRER